MDLAEKVHETPTPAAGASTAELIHAEFRARRAGRALAAGRVREAAAGALQAMKLPLLRRRAAQLARVAVAGASPVLIPLLAPEAAALPSHDAR